MKPVSSQRLEPTEVSQMNYLYLFLSVAFNVASYLVYKSIAQRQHDFSWSVIFIFGLILGGINVYLFIKALKSINLSIAYPIFSGACLALIMILSHIVFEEKISSLNIIGTIVIFVGIVLLSN
jgi:multidrug transporter EmrE-like cation transporter